MDTQPQTYDVRPWPLRLEERIARLEEAVRRLEAQRAAQQQPLYVIESQDESTGRHVVTEALPYAEAFERFAAECEACHAANYERIASWRNANGETGATWKAGMGIYAGVRLRCDRVGSEMLNGAAK